MLEFLAKSFKSVLNFNSEAETKIAEPDECEVLPVASKLEPIPIDSIDQFDSCDHTKNATRSFELVPEEVQLGGEKELDGEKELEGGMELEGEMKFGEPGVGEEAVDSDEDLPIISFNQRNDSLFQPVKPAILCVENNAPTENESFAEPKKEDLKLMQEPSSTNNDIASVDEYPIYVDALPPLHAELETDNRIETDSKALKKCGKSKIQTEIEGLAFTDSEEDVPNCKATHLELAISDEKAKIKTDIVGLEFSDKDSNSNIQAKSPRSFQFSFPGTLSLESRLMKCLLEGIGAEENVSAEEADRLEKELADMFEYKSHECRQQIPQDVWHKLLPHQMDGVSWLFRLLEHGKSGLLGDDMGLGKTVQISVFLLGAFKSGKISNALLILPKSLVVNWSEELYKWFPGANVSVFEKNDKKSKAQIEKIQRRGGLCLTTYGMVRTSSEALSGTKEWDVVILDEAHVMKNRKTQTSESLCNIKARIKLMLTGTPIQNRLMELWALFDFLFDGKLLGSFEEFRNTFDIPITEGSNRNASESAALLGRKLAQVLRKVTGFFWLQRKKDILSMPKKHELIMWIQLTQAQVDLYRSFLESPAVHEALNKTRSPLAALDVLKRICDHPRLISSDTESYRILSEFQHKELSEMEHSSGKLACLVELLDALRSNKHRVLVFSQSLMMLNIIEECIKSNWPNDRYLRIDGSIIKTEQRQRLVHTFNMDESIPFFLLTTKVGAFGLNLTGADRVVIFDPCWNPAADNQAEDRAYRYGQTKDVVVYKFVTCGTIEEKIYRTQIYKYFNADELKNLFVLGDTQVSETARLLSFVNDTCSDEEVNRMVALLPRLIPGLSDVSIHHLLYEIEELPAAVFDEYSIHMSARKSTSHFRERENRGPNSTPSTPIFTKASDTVKAKDRIKLDRWQEMLERGELSQLQNEISDAIKFKGQRNTDLLQMKLREIEFMAQTGFRIRQ